MAGLRDPAELINLAGFIRSVRAHEIGSRTIGPVTLNQLRVFEAVARTGSFSRAAEALSVTQPAVTLQIRQLERDCGVRLFERIRRRPRLTDAGAVLQDYARRIFALVDEAGRHLEGARGLTSGRLRLVTGPTGSAYATDLIAAFHRRYPGIHVALGLDTSERIVHRIVTLGDDVALVGEEQQHPTLARQPFCGDPLVVIVGPTHAWARRRTVSVRELADVPLITRETVSTTRRFLEARLGSATRRLRVAMELGSNDAIKRAVELGIGVGIVSQEVVRTEVRTGAVRALGIRERGFVHRLDLVYHRDRADSPLIAAVCEMARTLTAHGRRRL
jgi:LysR family transcriptional regulator, low CO2-responsive transcriptional regulator